MALCGGKKRVKVSRFFFTRVMLTAWVLLLSYQYLDYFYAYLAHGEWLDLENGFTRILIPDTFIYKSIIDTDNVWLSIILSGVKNTIGPSFIWYAAQFDWFIVLFINVVIIWFIFVFFEKNLNYYGVSPRVAQHTMLVFALLPSTSFYAIGALKELPTMLLLLMLVYFYNRRRLFIVLWVSVALIFFRYQLIVILLGTVAITRFNNRSFRFSLFAIIALSLIYPVIISFGMLEMEAVERFRSSQTETYGAIIENIRNNYYGFSFFAIVVRVLQTLFEPMFGFIPNPIEYFYEEGMFSIFRFVQVSTILIMMPYIYKTVFKMINLYRLDGYLHNSINALYVIILLSFFLVGGFSFIHHRYLVTFFPLIMIAAIIPLSTSLHTTTPIPKKSIPLAPTRGEW